MCLLTDRLLWYFLVCQNDEYRMKLEDAKIGLIAWTPENSFAAGLSDTAVYKSSGLFIEQSDSLKCTNSLQSLVRDLFERAQTGG